jgi:hypothetical protein
MFYELQAKLRCITGERTGFYLPLYFQQERAFMRKIFIDQDRNLS